MVIPSMPAAPPLRSTRFIAVCRFCFSQTTAHSPASEVRSSRIEDGSAPGSSPIGFTDFVGSVVSLSGKGCLLCSSCKLLKLLFLSDVRPFPSDGGGTTASADSCHLNLTSQSGLPVFRCKGRPPQVRTLTFPAPLSHLLLRPLNALGFVVRCQLARPHSLLWTSCSSGRRFAASFLQTSPHGELLAFG